MLKYLFGILFCLFFSSGELMFFILILSFFFFLNRTEGKNFFINSIFEVDFFSFSFIRLSLWVVILCYLSSIFLREGVS